jgi:hypothetical protein
MLEEIVVAMMIVPRNLNCLEGARSTEITFNGTPYLGTDPCVSIAASKVKSVKILKVEVEVCLTIKQKATIEIAIGSMSMRIMSFATGRRSLGLHLNW